MATSMKQRFVGTRYGALLLSIRRWRELRAVPLQNPEQAALVANGIIADKLIQHLCPSNGTFLDIGAHIGSVLSSVYSTNNTVYILAVEADPSKASHLRSKFPWCQVYNVAVGEEAGEAEFFIYDSASGYNSLVPDKTGSNRSIQVKVVLLDTLLPDARVDVIKIDIEGAELGALKGASALIRRSRPTIMFESAVIEVNSLGYSPELLWQWFSENDYVVMTPDRLAHDAPPLSLSAFLDAHFFPFRTLNYFAIHQDRRKEVRDRARECLGISAG